LIREFRPVPRRLMEEGGVRHPLFIRFPESGKLNPGFAG